MNSKMARTNGDKHASLPVELLTAIISCLPFEDAARTSVLCKEWCYLWLHTKNIEFDERFFSKSEGESSETVQKNQRRLFVNYFNNWVRNYRGPGAEKFRLIFSHPEDHLLDMERFISFATKGNLKMLDLDFSDPSWDKEADDIHQSFLQLPSYNGLEMLESLKLYSCNLPLLSGFPIFSVLKSISFGWISITPGTLEKLLSRCPSLETLSFNRCHNMGCVDINAPNLKSLIIDNCTRGLESIILRASNLKYFKYSGEVIGFDFGWFEALEEVELDLGRQTESGFIGDLPYDMLENISSARTLTVCSFMLQVITIGEECLDLKPKMNVRHLILKTSLNKNEFYGITFLLKSCPLLELLTINMVPGRILEDYEPPFPLREHVFLNHLYAEMITFKCLRRTLSAIVVNGFKGEEDEIAVLGYFLKFGRVLNTLRLGISLEGCSDIEKKISRLLQFRRSSSRPHVEIF